MKHNDETYRTLFGDNLADFEIEVTNDNIDLILQKVNKINHSGNFVRRWIRNFSVVVIISTSIFLIEKYNPVKNRK